VPARAVARNDQTAPKDPATAPAAETLERALRTRLEVVSPLRSGEAATVVFDARDGAWTYHMQGHQIRLAEGRTAHPTTTIIADAQTLVALLEGALSGVDAFLSGRLRIRGNMALALQLEGFDHPAKPLRFPRAKRVQARGIDTFYLEAGHGQPVVLLHGLGATNASMLPTLADLAQRCRVLAPDLPGFGSSAKPFGRYNPAFFAHWLTAFLSAVGVERAHLIGNSMGGRVAIETALRCPERVDRLVLYAPSMAFRRLRTFVPIVRLLAAEMGALPIMVPRATVLGILRFLFAQPSRLPDSWYDAAADEFLRVFATVRGRVAFFSAARQIYIEEAHGASGFWNRLARLRRPALFLWGDNDRLVPHAFARHVEAVLPHAESVVLQDCGHVPQYEHPAATHGIVRRFLGMSC
jgi:pimeloyl-ACP methyl ester carboxylesterase/putative sterol carrier protein